MNIWLEKWYLMSIASSELHRIASISARDLKISLIMFAYIWMILRVIGELLVTMARRRRRMVKPIEFKFTTVIVHPWNWSS